VEFAAYEVAETVYGERDLCVPRITENTRRRDKAMLCLQFLINNSGYTNAFVCLDSQIIIFFTANRLSRTLPLKLSVLGSLVCGLEFAEPRWWTCPFLTSSSTQLVLVFDSRTYMGFMMKLHWEASLQQHFTNLSPRDRSLSLGRQYF
jgi:hypothetical protein